MTPSLKGFNDSWELLIVGFILSFIGDCLSREKSYWVLLVHFGLEEFGSSWVTWSEEYWSEVIWLRTPPIAYPKASVSIRIWHFGSKCLRIGALVKAFRRYIKAFLASRVRKSVPEELTFTKSDFLGLVNFVAVDRFLILPSPPAPPAPAATS